MGLDFGALGWVELGQVLPKGGLPSTALESSRAQ